MLTGKLTWKAILLLIAVLTAMVGASVPAMAQKGVWWWGSTKNYGVTLINLTDYTLKLVPDQTDIHSNSENCFPYPFEVLGVNIKPYSSAVWQTSTTTVTIINYIGKMTFLPNGMDPKWAFNLNFRHQDASGAHLGKGTWVYLTANDLTNLGWLDSWSSGFSFGGYQMPLGYPTPLNDGNPHNIMNLEGNGYGVTFAVSMYSPNNSHVVVVVQQMGQTDPYYRAWRVNYADNNDDSMPH